MTTTDQPRHSVSVAAVIVDDRGQALAVQRRDNEHWEPPGGVPELAESIEDGLRREVREETGLDITVEALAGAYKNLHAASWLWSLAVAWPAAGSPPATRRPSLHGSHPTTFGRPWTRPTPSGCSTPWTTGHPTSVCTTVRQ